MPLGAFWIHPGKLLIMHHDSSNSIPNGHHSVRNYVNYLVKDPHNSPCPVCFINLSLLFLVNGIQLKYILNSENPIIQILLQETLPTTTQRSFFQFPGHNLKPIEIESLLIFKSI